jgi:chemotaxis protein histidine kinase CheA
LSIEERDGHVGRHLEVDSRRDRGTRVTLLIPLTPEP